MKRGESCSGHETITYVERNVRRINYAKVCNKRRSIGGGNVEATRKSFYA
jgi:hypothetical protein